MYRKRSSSQDSPWIIKSIVQLYDENNYWVWFFCFIAYNYVILLTIASLGWYAALIYNPPLFWYSYYPTAITIGCYIGAVWTPEDRFLLVIIQEFSGFFSIVLNLIYASQIANIGTTVEFQGNYNFPPLSSNNNVESVASAKNPASANVIETTASPRYDELT